MFVAGTVMTYGLLVVPSFQAMNCQLFEAAAVSTALLPTRYTAPPITLPALVGSASPVTVLTWAKFPVQTVGLSGTTKIHGLFVTVPFQFRNTQPLVAVASTLAELPIA